MTQTLVSADKVVGSFTAAAQDSAQILARKIDLRISGTFSGTIHVERLMNGVWALHGLPITGETEVVVEVAARRRLIRLHVDAWTSGQADYVLEADDGKAVA